MSVVRGKGKPRETDLGRSWSLPALVAGASALVGPRWAVQPEVDLQFYRELYRLVRQGLRLGEAVWRARAAVREAFPASFDPLAYALYGHPYCDPYTVRGSRGFAEFEVLGYPEDAPLIAGRQYTFRASYRAVPPLWHRGYVHWQEDDPGSEPIQVMVAPLTGTGQPETYRLEPLVQSGCAWQCLVPLTVPGGEESLPLLVRFDRGRDELLTLTLNLDVIQDEPAGGSGSAPR